MNKKKQKIINELKLFVRSQSRTNLCSYAKKALEKMQKKAFPRGVGSRGGGFRGPSWIFIHGTNIVDRGLKVLFFGLFLLVFGLSFFRCSPPGRG